MRTAPLDAATLGACISAAVAAPSIYNTQPWRFRLDPETVVLEVRAVPERGLRHADPVGRALHLSVGAAVFNLRVAAAHFGWAPVVRLLPDPEDPSVLANLRLAGAAQRHTAGQRPDLYPMIWRRHSSRFPFTGRPLPPNVRVELIDAARTEGASLTFPPAAETARLLRVATAAEHRNRVDPDRAVESRRWVHRDPDDSADLGIPQAALGPQDAREQLPLRDFTAQRHPERLPAQPFESLPVVALLTTEHDRRSDWLRAGQALEHLLLVATTHGLRASLVHQPMEWPDLRREVSPVPDRTGHAQMLIRLGYGPQGPATPRRAPDQVC
ncbi:Acg family FMN-binding oxidoreductase [Streptomyces sp. NPDC101152]|uniref:Acg family FMN-binding oxidoreductase n=1 Tax=Streptomyces sp. NPDC101152 TaxID=3366116 RepID=UPI003801312E